MTVHGHFDTVTGDGKVAGDGTVSGEIRIAAESVNTKNKQRDKHLRSDDFFAAEAHPTIAISAAGLKPAGGTELRGPITLSAAGHQQAVDTVVQVVSATAEAHPTIAISAAGLKPAGGTELRGPITLSAAGHQQAVDTVVQVVSATAEDVTVRAEATVDRTTFDMTWSPLHMTRSEARAAVTARFVRN